MHCTKIQLVRTYRYIIIELFITTNFSQTFDQFFLHHLQLLIPDTILVIRNTTYLMVLASPADRIVRVVSASVSEFGSKPSSLAVTFTAALLLSLTMHPPEIIVNLNFTFKFLQQKNGASFYHKINLF